MILEQADSCCLPVAIIADDLTGACAVGALLASYGRVQIQLSGPETPDGVDVLIVPTGTRTIPVHIAYARTHQTARALLALQPALMSKRIDSTLRGHVGVELRALLRVMQQCAIVVPAAPASGRTTVGGFQYVGGVPVADTEAGRDPWSPASRSSVLDLLSEHAGMPVAHVALADVRRGVDFVHNLILNATARVVVCDAELDSDIETIAQACTSISLVAVDPGPFTAALARSRFTWHGVERTFPKVDGVLVLAGSPTAVTGQQVRMLESALGKPLEALDVARLDDSAYVGALAKRVVATLLTGPVAGLRTEGRRFEQRDAAVAAALAKIAAAVLAERRAGVVATGGDVAMAVCRRIGVERIEVSHQVFPLCAAGRFGDGPFEGTPIITKGGMVGDDLALATCVRALLEGRVYE